MDYAIGDPAWIGRGAGTELIAVLVHEIRRQFPRAGMLVGPEAANTPRGAFWRRTALSSSR